LITGIIRREKVSDLLGLTSSETPRFKVLLDKNRRCLRVTRTTVCFPSYGQATSSRC